MIQTFLIFLSCSVATAAVLCIAITIGAKHDKKMVALERRRQATLYPGEVISMQKRRSRNRG